MLSEPAIYREGAESLLAKNLVAARLLAGLTQRELADASSVSRATIAQLETGCSDPRLSTIVELAKALNIPPTVLLLGIEEVLTFAALLGATPPTSGKSGDSISVAGTAPIPLTLPEVSPSELARMDQLLQTGMLKDRVRVARIGAAVARGGAAVTTPIIAGIFSAILPGAGTVAGAAIGELLARPRR